MSILGLIVEYNPFHNGHLYHFNTSLDLTQAEYSVCIMSGNFVQRGEPAIVDKWSRTQMALQAGMHLVIELPTIYCIQSAEFFAYGSVSILNKLKIVDNICFGSESGDIETLKNIAEVVSREPKEYKDYLKHYTQRGESFVSSRSKALIRYFKKINHSIHNDELEAILQSSNNILAIEYIKWLLRLNSTIKPVTIKRMHSKYNDETLDNPLASATAIRKAIKEQNLNNLYNFAPKYTFDILKRQFDSGKGPVFIDDFFHPIICMLRNMPAENFLNYMDVSEGLENRMKKAAILSTSIDELIENIKTKRYTETRIKRILMNLLLGIHKKNLMEFYNSGGPQYIRVLGFSEKGKYLLSKIKKVCDIPIITNVSDYRKYDNENLKRMIEFDISASDVYVTAYKNSSLKRGGYDFYQKPLMV